ncbi:MAG: hypothetical protein ACPL1Y_04855 [Thermoplasmata archaeon]
MTKDVPSDRYQVETEESQKKEKKKKQYFLPSEQEILGAATTLFALGGTVDSQEKMRRLILDMLTKENKLYKLSGKRVRKILLHGGVVKVHIVARESEGARPYYVCPVCDTKLSKIINRTLNGSEVIIGYRCPLCGYWAHRKKRVPMRYIFTFVRNS